MTTSHRVELDFDPLRELLVDPNIRPERVSPVNLRALSPFQRALLVIDGTVTKFIEAYQMEPVDVTKLSQRQSVLPSQDTRLEAEAGESVIVREVLLTGKYSRTVYAYAISLLVPSRLPEELTGELHLDGTSLGRILLGHRLETRREVLWFGREQLVDLPEAVRQRTGDEFVSRTYRIIAGGHPIILISEKFPLEKEGFPSHD
jgi:chorismate-pyruvate lyase